MIRLDWGRLGGLDLFESRAKNSGKLKVSKEQSQPQIVAEIRLRIIIEPWFWDRDHFNTRF